MPKVKVLVEAGIYGDGYRVIVPKDVDQELECRWFGIWQKPEMYKFINGREIEWLPGENAWAEREVSEGFFRTMVKNYKDVEEHENWRKKEGYADA